MSLISQVELERLLELADLMRLVNVSPSSGVHLKSLSTSSITDYRGFTEIRIDVTLISVDNK